MARKILLFQNLMLVFTLLLTSCVSVSNAPVAAMPGTPATQTPAPVSVATALPTRPPFSPGELVDYVAQTGDTLPALAIRFNTTEAEIRAANPIIPKDATTMPPGFPMKIPIYYRALWGSYYQIIPDNAFVLGPSTKDFDTEAFINSQPGWLKNYTDYVNMGHRTAGEIIDFVAYNYSINPRLLLALLEYQSGALSQPGEVIPEFSLGIQRPFYGRVYLQLIEAANALNDGYYRWRIGGVTEFELPDGTLQRPDPWQNAASISLHLFFAQQYSDEQFAHAVSPDGFAHTYKTLFGDPWLDQSVLIPGSLQQPEFLLPFPVGQIWAYTGGPHTGWGRSAPYAALDFAPASNQSGCFPAADNSFSTAVASGVVVRTNVGLVVLDLDGDGDERTGWVVMYFHISSRDRPTVGTRIEAGQFIGYPSCEGGTSTGTHIHIARKYNGEWMLAAGTLAFNLEGWIAENGEKAYEGTMRRGEQVVRACVCADALSQLTAGK